MSCSHSALEGSRSSEEKHNSKNFKREAVQDADGHKEKSFRRHSQRRISGMCRTSGTTRREWGCSSDAHTDDAAFHTPTVAAAVASEAWGSENLPSYSNDVSIKGGGCGQPLVESSVTDIHAVESANGSAESSLTGYVGNAVRFGAKSSRQDPYESVHCTPFPSRRAERQDGGEMHKTPSKPSTKFSKGSASVVSNVLTDEWDDDATSPEKRHLVDVHRQRTPIRFRNVVHVSAFGAPTQRFKLGSPDVDSSGSGGEGVARSNKEGEGDSGLDFVYVPPPYPVDLDWEE